MPLLIAHLSDVHVRPRGELYKGVADSNLMLREALGHLHSLDYKPDLLIITGDLVDEGQPAEYAMLRDLLSAADMPCYLMPGNHDHREQLCAALPAHSYLPSSGPMNFCIDSHDPVRIVSLDATVPGKHHGRADSASLEWLRATLAADRQRPTLLLLHHPPFVSGIPYLDQYRLFDTDELAAIVQAAPNIEAVLCGHVHRSMARRWAGTVVLACPSTTTEIALQLLPDATPQSYLGPPACLLHWWTPEHGLVTHTSYIGRFDGPFPFY